MQINYGSIKASGIDELIKEIYYERNSFIHEGKGYQSKFSSSKSLHDYQGLYKGMKPFAYRGAFTSYKDLNKIKNLFLCVIDVLFSDQFIIQLSTVKYNSNFCT